jgi:hypothetical protein
MCNCISCLLQTFALVSNEEHDIHAVAWVAMQILEKTKLIKENAYRYKLILIPLVSKKLNVFIESIFH